MSRLLYCNSLLTGENKTVTNNIDRLVNRPTRIICNLKNTDYTTSITNLRKSLNWLPTIDNINIKLYFTKLQKQLNLIIYILHKQTTKIQLRQTYRLDIHDYESTVTNDLAGEVQLSGINSPNPYAKKICQ